jgi:hypothetical protein
MKTKANTLNNEKITKDLEAIKQQKSNNIKTIDNMSKKNIKISSKNVKENNDQVKKAKTTDNNIIEDKKDIKDIKKPFEKYYKNADINNKITIFNHSKESKYEMKKDEEKYLKKKRKKMTEKVNKGNESSNLFYKFNGAVKKYFLKNCVVNKITERIFDNFEPIGNRIIDKNQKRIQKEKEIHKLINELLFLYKYEEDEDIIDIIDLLSFKEETKIKLLNSLSMFDIYKELLDQFKRKWDNQKSNDTYYQRLRQFYSFETKKKEESEEEELNFFEKIDARFYIYKDLLRREYLLSFEPLFLIKENMIKGKKEHKESILKKNHSSKYLPNKKTSSSLKQRSSVNKNKINRSVSFKEEDQKMSTFSKIQKDYGFVRNTQSLDKFSKLYRISLFSRKSTKILNELSWSNKIKEKNFKDAQKDLDNYNILKNPNLFHHTNKNKIKINLEKKPLNQKQDLKKLSKQTILNNMIIRFSGISLLTKEAAAIKTREMNQDSPYVKLFNQFVSLLIKREINQFIELIQKESEGFLKIINNQEFSTGNTLLIYATQNNLKSIVELLLLNHADPNIQNHFGNTPLHIAYSNNNTFIINLLFENGADQKIKNIKGLFPWQMTKNFND